MLRSRAVFAVALVTSLSSLTIVLAHCGSDEDATVASFAEGGPDAPPEDALDEGDAPLGPAAFPCDAGIGAFARCPDNPLYLAGASLPDGNLEISVGDPDTFFDEEERKWKMWWSTGAAKSFGQADGAPIHIKYAESVDGIHWDVQKEPVLESGSDETNWDNTKIETPSVIKVASNPPSRRYVMYYAGGNDVDHPKLPSLTYTWYQLGIAFSPDGKKFTRLPASESPYAGKATGFRKIDGLLLLGRDAFPGLADVGDGLLADPEIVFDGTEYHLLFSSLATKTDRTSYLAYGMSQARSTNGVTFTMATGNPRVVGGTQPSVVRVGNAYELYLVHDSPEDDVRVPTNFNPYYGMWKRTSTDLVTWSDRGATHEFTFDVNVRSEHYGWVKAGDMAYRDGIRRYYYVAFGDQNVPTGFATLLRQDAGVALPDGSVDLGATGVLVPAVIGLHVAARRD